MSGRISNSEIVQSNLTLKDIAEVIKDLEERKSVLLKGNLVDNDKLLKLLNDQTGVLSDHEKLYQGIVTTFSRRGN